MQTAARDSALPGHNPARRIVERDHFRLLYERNPIDIRTNIDAVRAVYNAACGTFPESLVRHEFLRLPLEYDFILHKHGPYSFDLSGVITAKRADMLLKLEPQLPYGPRIVLGEESEQVKRRYPKTTTQYDAETSFVAERLRPMRVVELERVATALYVTLELGESADREVPSATSSRAQTAYIS